MENLEQHFSENLLLTTSRHETQSSNSVREYSDPVCVDLLVDILSRLPRKSIGRFRCVSNLWASILRRPDFTELFLTKSMTRPRLFFTIKVADGKFYLYSTPQPQNLNENSSLVATPYHTSWPRYFPTGTCSQVCGYVLLQEWGRKVRVICNPATGEFLTLPNVKAKSNPDDPKAKEKIAGTYFGYDPIGKQFKVLCMASSRVERPNTHQVLTLESGKKRFWRPVERKFHFVKNHGISGEICINGVLYFGAEFRGFSVIICFDVRSEKFDLINTDKGMLPGNSYYDVGFFTLFSYKGKLGLYQERITNGEMVFWVLEDAENKKWSKHICVLSCLGMILVTYSRFIGMTSTGEIVYSSLRKLADTFYWFYNLERKDFIRVHIQGFEEFKHHRVFHKTYLDYVENMKSFMKFCSMLSYKNMHLWI